MTSFDSQEMGLSPDESAEEVCDSYFATDQSNEEHSIQAAVILS